MSTKWRTYAPPENLVVTKNGTVTASAVNLDPRRYADTRLRWEILERDDYRCCYCRKAVTFEDANIDHVIPWRDGGRTDRANLVAACKQCNRFKGNKYITPAKPARKKKRKGKRKPKSERKPLGTNSIILRREQRAREDAIRAHPSITPGPPLSHPFR